MASARSAIHPEDRMSDTDPKTILIIDDDREIAGTLQMVLQNAGYQVSLASNGVEGQRLIDGLKPDLVITDMMMPKMGGFPVLEFIKQQEHRPAVIMVTANEGGRHKAYAEMLGVADYLRKPFPMEVLLESVRRVFAGEEKPDPDAKPVKRGRKKKTSE
jgi:DNA-binding response OmpR family regulator